jgi:hypothetical protein
MTAAYHGLASGDFSQDWSDTNRISVNDDWSGVPSVLGFLSGIGTAGGTNPSTLTGTSTTVDVNANQTNPATFISGGVTEFELSNPTVALAGSNSAGSPYVQLHIDSTGVNSVDVRYNIRDLDTSVDNATQAVALQYRTSTSATWTNLPAYFVADATTGGSATQVTPIAATLPADAGNQPTLQVRIITGNASGNDEPVGIDDIIVAPTPVVSPPGAFQLDSRGVRIDENAGTATVTVTRQGGTGGAVMVDYATADLTATAGADYIATRGTLAFADGQETADITIPLTNDAADELAETLSVTLSNPTGGATLNPSSSNVVTIVDVDGQPLSAGPLVQDWSNTELIAINDDWNGVLNITGYLSDADRDAGVIDAIANQSNPAGQSQGGVGEFDGIGDPTVALQGSNAAASPHLIFDIDTRGVTSVDVEFDALDIDSSADDSVQPISVGYRIGNAGDFIEISSIEDATTGPSLADLVTHMLASLPAEAVGQELVQIRVATLNAAGNDEWVGIDNIRIGASGVVAEPPTLTSSQFHFQSNQSVELVFDKDVAGSFDSSDIQLQNLTTGQFVPSANILISSSTVGGSTTTNVTFASLLADGNYSLRVLAEGISAVGGPSNSADLVASPFYVLAGDGDRDRTVGFQDLVVLAQNYGGVDKTFGEGDFNYDTKVDFADLVILAQKYNATLPALLAVPIKGGAGGKTGEAIFSSKAIDAVGLSDSGASHSSLSLSVTPASTKRTKTSC